MSKISFYFFALYLCPHRSSEGEGTVLHLFNDPPSYHINFGSLLIVFEDPYYIGIFEKRGLRVGGFPQPGEVGWGSHLRKALAVLSKSSAAAEGFRGGRGQ